MRRERSSRWSGYALLFGGLLASGPLMALDLQGVSAWGSRVVLSTSVSGMVSKVEVAPGDVVDQGSLLLSLDTRGHQARLAAAQARVEAARQLNAETRRELDRTLELYDRTLISEHERKLAEITLTESDASLREAEAKLVAIRLQREYSRVKAPFSGLILAVHVQPGQAVVNRTEATPLVTLADHRHMVARVVADQPTLTKIQPGDPVQVGVRGRWLEGVIDGWGYEPVEGGGSMVSYRLQARFTPDAGMILRAGEQLVVRLANE
jgi:multidrug efflux system membrane fusion protein